MANFCTVLQVVDNGPAESSSFAVESLARTFDLEPADALGNEVIGKEVLGNGPLLEILENSVWVRPSLNRKNELNHCTGKDGVNIITKPREFVPLLRANLNF